MGRIRFVRGSIGCLPEYLHPYENLQAEHEWKRPKGFIADSVHEDMTRGWKDLDRSVGPVDAWTGWDACRAEAAEALYGELLEGL